MNSERLLNNQTYDDGLMSALCSSVNDWGQVYVCTYINKNQPAIKHAHTELSLARVTCESISIMTRNLSFVCFHIIISLTQ